MSSPFESTPSGASQPPPPAPPSDAEATNGLASMGQRMAALLIDGLVLFMMIMVAVIPFVDLEAMQTGEQPEFAPRELLLIRAIVVVLWASYTIPAVTRWGQTIGRFLVGIRVARIGDGKSPDFGQAAIRSLLPTTFFLVPAIGPVLSFAVLIKAAFDPERRGWHDYAAGTVVLKK